MSSLARHPILLLSALVGCAAPIRHPAEDYDSHQPAPRLHADRHCEEVKPELKEQCALSGNPVQGRAEVLDMYHLRVFLRLGQMVSGCDEIRLTTTVTFPDGTARRLSSTIACKQECMPEGPGGGVCRDLPHQELEYDLDLEEPLPFFRLDGTSEAGEIPLRVTSARGHLQPRELIARTAAEPARYPDAVVPAPAPDRCEEFNRNQSRLTALEHERRYGCPPCPCACHNGQITCAPCAACEAFGPPPVPPDQPVPPPSNR